MNSWAAPLMIAQTLFLYACAWLWLVALADSLRGRRWAGLVVLVAAGAAGAAAATRATGIPPAVGGLVALAGVALYALLLRPRAMAWAERKTLREDARQAALHLVLLTGCLLFSLPYAWMVLTSFKPDTAIFKNPTALPNPWMWENYPTTFQFLDVALGKIRSGFGSLFVLNTLQVTALSMAGMLFSSSLVAFAFARLRWPGRDVLFLVLLGTMMLPDAVTMIPRFIIYRALGWVDTLQPLWFGSLFAGAFNVFMLRQFMLGIPNDLEDAAKIDGCGYFGIYWRVAMPLMKPALAALAIMHFIATWNDFMGPLIYLSSPEKMTGSYALRLFQSANSGEWAWLMAAATLWTLPVIMLFFFAQRAFIEGIALTGMKN